MNGGTIFEEGSSIVLDRLDLIDSRSDSNWIEISRETFLQQSDRASAALHETRRLRYVALRMLDNQYRSGPKE